LLISNDLRLIFTSTLFLAVPITFHIARHTFATTITLQREIPLETVSKMLGHANIATTQIYARVVDTKVMKDMAALKDMYAKKESQKSPNNKAANE
jgi:site-specific recombinase XerD